MILCLAGFSKSAKDDDPGIHTELSELLDSREAWLDPRFLVINTKQVYSQKRSNGGFLKWGYPQIIHFDRMFPL
jgi:hypothetical protein